MCIMTDDLKKKLPQTDHQSSNNTAENSPQPSKEASVATPSPAHIGQPQRLSTTGMSLNLVLYIFELIVFCKVHHEPKNTESSEQQGESETMSESMIFGSFSDEMKRLESSGYSKDVLEDPVMGRESSKLLLDINKHAECIAIVRMKAAHHAQRTLGKRPQSVEFYWNALSKVDLEFCKRYYTTCRSGKPKERLTEFLLSHPFFEELKGEDLEDSIEQWDEVAEVFSSRNVEPKLSRQVYFRAMVACESLLSEKAVACGIATNVIHKVLANRNERGIPSHSEIYKLLVTLKSEQIVDALYKDRADDLLGFVSSITGKPAIHILDMPFQDSLHILDGVWGQITVSMDLFKHTTSYYAPYSVICQSSGYGKTKLMLELSSKTYLFFSCLRDVRATGDPQRSVIASTFLSLKTEADFAAYYYAFFKELRKLFQT